MIYLACVALFGFAFWSYRTSNLAGFANAKRTLWAMHRATTAGLLQTARSGSFFLAAAIIAWVAAKVFAVASGFSRGSVLAATYSVVATAAGCICVVTLSYLAVHWARASAIRTISAALVSFDRLMQVVTRMATALTVAVEAAAFLCSAAIVALSWATHPHWGSASNVHDNPLLSAFRYLPISPLVPY